MLLWKKISKDDLVLTCGVAFLEIEWTSGSLFYWKLSRQCLFDPTRYPKRVVRVCQEKPRHFLLNAKVGIFRSYRQCLQQHSGNFEQPE
jgi:hypothetical protein